MRIVALAPHKTTESLVGLSLRLTAVDGSRAVENTLVLNAPVSAAAVPAPDRSLVVTLLLAVVGGLILNLMPCVLPILSLKLMAVVGQQPRFLVFMAVVVALFAANLFGLFEIRLPGAVSDYALQASAAGNGIGGHFLTGAFTTLLATPCSAPFLGTAVGFAFSRGAVEIYAVFLSLGVGLALPFLAVAAFPKIVIRMPRPGPWMFTLRRVLGLALAATAVWLLSVLAVHMGLERAVAIGVALITLGGGLTLVGSKAPARSGAGFAVSAAASLSLAR